MGSNQQFCLRWHNYQSSLLASLPQFLDGDDLTDALQPVQHPVIVLPGANFTDLCALVTFMYSGEVNIYQDQLRGLLNMADAMQIRGLAETPGRLNNNDVSTGKKEPTPKRAKLSPCSSVKQEINKPLQGDSHLTNRYLKSKVHPVSGFDNYTGLFGSQQTDGSTEDLERGEEQVMIKTEDGGTLKTDIESVENKVGQGELSPSSEDSLGGLCGLEAMERMSTEHLTNFKLSPTRNTTSKLFATCLVCGKQLSNQYNLRVHMETHQNLNYACRVCSHVSRSRDALRKHVSYRHPGEGISPRSLKKNKTLSPGNILVEPGNGLMQP
ncbi:unnamed protein product [Timema podura]|uniref:C2H2-type domain-containing protein n=1 Tax=Timema podura TaxID=61482 RepID=A0ABN7NIP5_TIMPD|nr:unnamed protein product [Timema podura]